MSSEDLDEIRVLGDWYLQSTKESQINPAGNHCFERMTTSLLQRKGPGKQDAPQVCMVVDLVFDDCFWSGG